VSLEIQFLAPEDVLRSWTEHDARASGLVPAAGYVSGNLINDFHFFVPFEYFTDDSFTVIVPPIEVDGTLVAMKPVSFKRVSERNVLLMCR